MQQLSDATDRVFEGLGVGRMGFGPVGRHSPFSSSGALSSLASPTAMTSVWSPTIEVRQNDGNIVIHADLPGLSRDDVRVDVGNGMLSIRGERKQNPHSLQGGVTHTERSYGHFQRSFALPEGANSGDVTARFQDGVSEVTIPSPQSSPATQRVETQ